MDWLWSMAVWMAAASSDALEAMKASWHVVQAARLAAVGTEFHMSLSGVFVTLRPLVPSAFLSLPAQAIQFARLVWASAPKTMKNVVTEEAGSAALIRW